MTLAPHHYAMLHTASAITDAVITARGYVSFDDPAEVKARGFASVQAKTAPVLAMPLWDVHGQQSSWQIRPENPRLKKGNVLKYETPAAGGVQLDVHPTVQPLLVDPAVPLWVTEGVKKGDALVSAGAPCAIALIGVWGFKRNGHMLPDWQHVALKGRTVYVVYDSDVATKKEVAHAQRDLLAWLRYRQALPACVEWPETYREKKWGVDDFLAAGHTLDDLVAMVPPIWGTPSQQAPAIGGRPEASGVTLLMTPTGSPRSALANVLEVLTKDSRWEKVLGYNAFSDEVVFLACPPCYQEDPWKARPLEDHDDAEIANWVQRHHKVFSATTVVHEAVQAAAHRATYHPIRDYLHKLKWDKVPRLDRWLPHYCGAPDTPYTRAVGATTLIGAVARVEHPGCKMDTALVLIGPQGIGKSTTWRVLCGDEWFSDTLPDLHDKDAMQTLRGKWIIELGEVATLHRSEIEVIKRYLSATQDHYRPSYGRRARTFLRQNIFVGTTNKEDIFKDETGNRRFYPITLAGTCAIAQLIADRDQLWAEAVSRYRQQEAWHLDAAMTAEAEKVQAEHMEIDPWEEPVREYAKDFAGKVKITTTEVMQQAFHWENPAQWTPAACKRIGAILRQDGWRPTKRYAHEATPTLPATTADPKAPRRRVAAFEKTTTPPRDTDDTDDDTENDTSVSSGNPHKIRRDTDDTDDTDTFTRIGKIPDKTHKTHKTQISQDFSSYSIEKSAVSSVSSVSDRMNTSANGDTDR